MFRVKCILFAFCLVAIAASQLYLKGVSDGIAQVDAEAFDAYVHFAKPMQAAAKETAHKPVKAEVHRVRRKEPAQTTVWAAVDGSN